MAFAAVSGGVPRLAWLLLVAVVFWVVAYDTLYAMADRAEDLRAGAKSTAILFGELDLLAVGICHGAFLLGMLLVGRQATLAWPFLAALAAAALLAAWQLAHARPRSPERCLAAFRANHWLGLILWAGIAAALALPPSLRALSPPARSPTGRSVARPPRRAPARRPAPWPRW
ncbi:MAG: UbiA family prenyltransferase [Xanthomonadales bacterium]|nr:UbiA family prenyltransferase [Xanthomonadales bacterium]